MTTEDLDHWQSILDRWQKDADELITDRKHHGVSYTMGINLLALVRQMQKELDGARNP